MSSIIGAQASQTSEPREVNKGNAAPENQEVVQDLSERAPSLDTPPSENANPEGQPKTFKLNRRGSRGSDQDERRNSIAEEMEARKAEASEPFSGDMADPRLNHSRHEPVEGVDALEAEAQRRAQDPLKANGLGPDGKPLTEQKAEPVTNLAQPAEPAPGEQMVELKVNGVTKQVPLSDLIANAQKYEAGDDRLAEAKRILEEAKQLRSDATQPGTPTGPQGTSAVNAQPGQDQQKPEVTPDLKELVRKIQMGDEDEAAEALLQFQSKGAAPADPKNLASDVASIVRLTQEQETSAAAVRDFAQRTPEFVNDPNARLIGSNMLIEEMRKDLRQAAKSTGTMTDAEIEQSLQNPDHVQLMHERARALGVGSARKMDALLQTSHDRFLEWKGVPRKEDPATPSTTPAGNGLRARGAAPQPAARALSPGFQRNVPQRESTSQTIAAMRAERMAR